MPNIVVNTVTVDAIAPSGTSALAGTVPAKYTYFAGMESVKYG